MKNKYRKQTRMPEDIFLVLHIQVHLEIQELNQTTYKNHINKRSIFIDSTSIGISLKIPFISRILFKFLEKTNKIKKELPCTKKDFLLFS
jgi:hypothetical protein